MSAEKEIIERLDIIIELLERIEEHTNNISAQSDEGD